LFGTTGLNLTEPRHEFCLSFGLGRRLVVVVIARRQLVPSVGTAPFCCHTGIDIDTADDVLRVTSFRIIDNSVMPVTASEVM
jgi:hypothetical protein